MPLSWNEIKTRAIAFSKEWAGEASEDAEAKSFWDAFFEVFGVHRRRIASFEVPIKREDGSGGFIDLLWKGILLVEHKSRGKDLDRAYGQARDYFPGLKDRDLPRYVLVSDFERFRLHDLETGEQHAFALKELHRHIRLFGFVAGYQSRPFKDQDPVNIKAAERMGKLHDALRDDGYTGHKLEVLLVRVLFCLFAEDTGIFEPRRRFQDYIEQRTSEDGSDLGGALATLFDVLNTAPDQRQKGLDAQLAGFPYVNGKLFEERLSPAAFNTTMRERLLDACGLDWSEISPAIFGALFQSIMDAKARRNLGAHYTSEKNILKLIGPLFLDDLRAEFDKLKASRPKLHEFHEKIAALKFLDPACGCGNFLVIAYRELRMLELDVIEALYQKDQEAGQVTDPRLLIKCNVDQFYGIEIEEFPAQIAQLALWLVDHQVNLRVSEMFGNPFERLPLKKSATIVHGNALRIDWNDVVPAAELDYILGNPPFSGAMVMSDQARADFAEVFSDVKGAKVLDFVAAWYWLAAKYVQGTGVDVGFVSTSSICQGEQVSLLWRPMLERLGIRINFAHQTFKWSNEARGNAAVHCIIIGFSLSDRLSKLIYEYPDVNGEPQVKPAANINPYLIDGPNVLLDNRSEPICDVPVMRFGSMPRDGGHLLLSDEERTRLLADEPDAAPYILPMIGAHGFLNGGSRWCIWFEGANPTVLRSLPRLRERVENVKAFRLASKASSTQSFAATPYLFCQIAQPVTDYILVPRHSSENRSLVPMGFLGPDKIAGDSCNTIPGATNFHFGVLQSSMHTAWVRYTCGRLKSDFRYSKDIVYNNFPWPESPSDKQRDAIEAAAQGVLDARAAFPDSTLADLYDPTTMPPALVKAHQTLDRAVDAAYGKRRFDSDAERVAFLFERYQQLTSLLPAAKPAKSPRRKTPATASD
ncbi:class I SAM-dependent DNA methyltransferase [Novilysobacter avium]|uniref:site-specific DNA-methyltransferase (adenine-specific) n=1 Tax=Novilysobacter avium TaxID=2781023 RepID=A0A7S6ULY1_9GAMM|nr:DNA methyltransferase [Lysobacter avium]QOW22644.1 class I SAM-dependent DNA methyltransferase [Lysobacter avium]